MFDSCMVTRMKVKIVWLRRIAAERFFFSFWAKSVAQVEKKLGELPKKKDKDVHAPL